MFFTFRMDKVPKLYTLKIYLHVTIWGHHFTSNENCQTWLLQVKKIRVQSYSFTDEIIQQTLPKVTTLTISDLTNV